MSKDTAFTKIIATVCLYIVKVFNWSISVTGIFCGGPPNY